MAHTHGCDAMQFAVVEAVAQHGLGGFCGVALAPEGDADPVADFGLLMFGFKHEADAAAELAVAAPGNGEPEIVLVAHMDQEIAGVLLGVRVGDAQGCGGNFAGAEQCHQRRDIHFSKGTKGEPGGFDVRHK